MGYSILVVDDELDLELLITQKFRRKIRTKEFEFLFAHNGLEALKCLDENSDITLILSDINMPEMDGLTLLTKLIERNNPLLETVIVSAYGDMDNIRTAMNRGAFDFVTKPIDFNDLDITINKTLEQIEKLKTALVEHDQLVSIQQDLNIARKIQQSILPKVFPPFPERKDFDIFAYMNAAKDVGGDFYDFFLIDNDRLGLVIADVSGKGISAALFMAVSRTMLKSTALKGMPASQCVSYANKLISEESVDCMFVTTFYGILNTKTGELDYVNAGHNPPFIVSENGTVKKVEMTGGMALGVMENFEFKSKQILLNAGDSLFLYTDGVNEAMDINGNQLTEKRLEDTLAKCRNASVEETCRHVTDEIDRFVADAEQSDDITILSVKYNG